MSAINFQLDTFGEIHKRTILYDNEVKKVSGIITILHLINSQLLHPQEIRQEALNLQYGDRFIPRRNKPSTANGPQSSPTEKGSECAKANGMYAGLLRTALGLKISRNLDLHDFSVPRPFFTSRTCEDESFGLNFTYCPHRNVCSSPTRYKDLDWMCKPRKKPKIDANSSHEFEGFAGTAVGTQIEWAWTGHIISYCENSLLLWNPAEDIITKYDLENVVTLAYHPYYRFLATSNHNKTRPSVNVWTFERGAMLNCFCHRPRTHYMVTTLCWNKYGLHLLTGNSKGVICSLDFHGTKELFHRTPPIHKMIKDIKFSATGQYVASLDIVGKLCIWSYNSGYLVLHHVWDSGTPTRVSMDWHPWTDFDIALCIQRGSQVLVLNILSKETEAYSMGRAFKFDRPVISFNRISAELILSCQRKGKWS